MFQVLIDSQLIETVEMFQVLIDTQLIENVEMLQVLNALSINSQLF
jgi:hypothetical protein